jgi:nucleoside phosphorylase
MACAVILTALSDEYLAVRSHLSDLQEEIHPQGTIYERGKFSDPNAVWDVGIVKIGAGNTRAAMEAERAIAHFNPNVIFFVGVAGGIKDVALGDVVAATKVYGYESGKANKTFETRTEIGRSAYNLEQRSRIEAGKPDWLKRLSVSEPIPRVFVAPIAAGEKVISSTKSEVFQFLRSNYGDAVAVEMEGLGFLEAARANQQVSAMVIRGISDLIDNKTEVDRTGYQKIAARHASAFAFEMLAKFQSTSTPSNTITISQSNLKEEFLNASKGLLNWKRTLGDNNQQITRPELEQLIDRIETETFSSTIVLGEPGCGKSALMATLGHWAVEAKYVLLAIKADDLSNTVNTIEDLQQDIQISRHPKEAVKAIANTEKVILLIDQLDAVSELLDRQPGRLNMLLSFIQSLSETKNVHIVATCREFEFRHGTQFARRDCFQRLDLQLPTWEQISPILENEKHNPHSMGEPLRELLRNPFHLRIFLEIAKPDQVFQSFPNLLDQLWEKRILNEPEAKESIDFLTKLAERMTEEEVLWPSAAIADENPEICRSLQKAGILMTNPDNSKLGFCHQTLYDHTLARSFARDSQSLSDFVLERQDGLFIRPILLRNLNYLRGTACQKYQREIQALLNTSKLKVRSHIRTLVIEFVGAQSNPNPTEVGLLVPLLNSEIEAIKVLDSMMGSPGWFRTLRDRPEFLQWLEKPVEQAVYCCPLLTAAASFAAEDVWSLLEEYWLNDRTYDFLSIRAIGNINQWTPERVWLTQQIIQRSNIGWYDVEEIAQKVATILPDLAAKILLAHLNQKLDLAILEGNKPKPELPADADVVTRYHHNSRYDSLQPIKNLLQQSNAIDFYEIKRFADACPQNFLNEIWAWFVDVSSRIMPNELRAINSYRDDNFISLELERGEILEALLIAVTKLATQEPKAFLRFVQQNENSELMAVHRFLARGLEQVASQEPQTVLEYLLANPKRLCIGDKWNCHRETKQLIAAVVPYLSPENRGLLEQTIHQFDYYLPKPEYPADSRFRRLQYNRQHRLRLLKAIPDEYLSGETQLLKQQEERVFPNLLDRDSQYPTIGQSVGPPMTKDQMSHASDKHLLNLFDELADLTDADCLFRKSSDSLARVGDSTELSHEFGKLVKDDPDYFLRILPKLKPERHEKYAGAALKNLAQTEFPESDLIELVKEFDKRGFTSEDFRNDAADALEKIAERNRGLPASVLALLESWLPTHTKPELEYYQSKDERHSNLKLPILFGLGGSHILPGGRGNIIRAIAEGYLRQNPPNLEGWEKFIRSQLGVEPHPAVWVYILTRMPPLLNGDRAKATELFDTVIHNYPEVLQYQFALYFIAHTVGGFEPKETVQSWLEMLRANKSNFSQQACGELLLIHYFQYQDEWSVERIGHHLATQDNEAILCGLAHAASHLWVEQRCRQIAAKILYTLASSSTESIQHAVASVFRWSRDRFQLNPGMVKIVEAICKNRGILLEAANDLTEIIETEELVDSHPEIVVKVCQSLIGIFADLTNPAPATAFIAESLTTIAIQLHCQPLYRDIGLQIFEDLLALNLRETRSALETLDRKPNRFGFYISPRRRLRSRRTDHH